MAIRKATELMEAMRKLLGDDTSDDTLLFIEDVNDTLSNYERMAADVTDWEAKYNALDQEWRARYRDRFFQAGDEDEKESFIEDVNDLEDQQDEAPTTFEELFEEVRK